MPYYPAFLDLSGRLAVVVGGGQVAARKSASLLRAGARLRLVAPETHAETRALMARGNIEHRARGFIPQDLEGAALVISATDDEDLNRQVAAEAEKRGILVNVVDVPELCSFIVPAVVRRGGLLLAISTSGASPAAARKVRQELEKFFGPAWAPYLNLMAAVRKRVLAQGRPALENRELFVRLTDSSLLEKVAAADAAGVEAILREVLGPGYGLADLGLSPDDLIGKVEPGGAE